jgi:hypothetical protein
MLSIFFSISCFEVYFGYYIYGVNIFFRYGNCHQLPRGGPPMMYRAHVYTGVSPHFNIYQPKYKCIQQGRKTNTQLHKKKKFVYTSALSVQLGAVLSHYLIQIFTL